MTQLVDGGGSYATDEELENDYVAPSEEEEDDVVDFIIDTAEDVPLGGNIGTTVDAASTFHSFGESIPDDQQDEIRDKAIDDEDAPWGAGVATSISTFLDDPSTDAGGDVVRSITIDGVTDAGDWAADTASDAASDAADEFLPDLPWKWVAGGVGLLVVLFVLSPYAELASTGVEAAG